MYEEIANEIEEKVGESYITKQQFYEISSGLRKRGYNKFAVQLGELDCKIRYIHILISQSNFKIAFKNLGELFESLKEVESGEDIERNELLYMWAHYCQLCNFLDRLIENDIDIRLDCSGYGEISGRALI